MLPIVFPDLHHPERFHYDMQVYVDQLCCQCHDEEGRAPQQQRRRVVWSSSTVRSVVGMVHWWLYNAVCGNDGAGTPVDDYSLEQWQGPPPIHRHMDEPELVERVLADMLRVNKRELQYRGMHRLARANATTIP